MNVRSLVLSGCLFLSCAALAAPVGFESTIRPLVQEFCLDCHSTDLQKGELDLEQFQSLAHVKKQPEIWIKVLEQLGNGEMPPSKKPQPTSDQRQLLSEWIRGQLDEIALSQAGDPGPVVLRRLSNAEYTYTISDLTGVDLDPAREFPVDGAAGEGFMNTGNALVMSPALLTKYLDAAKGIAEHAVLLPEGFRFSPHTSRRDWTDDLLHQIRAFYATFTDAGGGARVNLQGVQFETNQGGLLPLAEYLEATLAERDALRRGDTTLEAVAQSRHLSVKYLGLLWNALTVRTASPSSALLNTLRARWEKSGPNDVDALVAWVGTWQRTLWTFNSVGQIGRKGSPDVWMQAVTPVASRRDFGFKLPEPANGQDVVFHLTAGDAHDGGVDDWVVWESPRLEAEGLPPLPLARIQGIQDSLSTYRQRVLSQTADYLAALSQADAQADAAALAARHDLDAGIMQAWLDYLDLGDAGPARVEGHYTESIRNGANYDFISGWGSDATPSVIANASDQQVRIPGVAKPLSVLAHPSPTLFTAAGWLSPMDAVVKVEARIADAHPECGNGVEWLVQHRNGRRTGNLAQGQFGTGGSATMPAQSLSVRRGELISLVLGPRDGNHSCDLTDINLIITETSDAQRVWDLAADVSGDILAGNPHPDRLGNEGVWHFLKGPMTDVNRQERHLDAVPPGSLLSLWQQAKDPEARMALAQRIQALALGLAPTAADSPDASLHQHLQTMARPSDFASLVASAPTDPRFGTRAGRPDIGIEDLAMKAPSQLAFLVPADLARGRQLVATARMLRAAGPSSATQPRIDATPIDPSGLWADAPFLVGEDKAGQDAFRAGLDAFRQLFPPALCYTKIVPVDEVVTLTLFYREDEHLQRLMLTETQTRELNRLWEELEFVSQEPLKLVVALEQLIQFATQDRNDLVPELEALKTPVQQRADTFSRKVVASEPSHIEALIGFANRAYRRPLGEQDIDALRLLYRSLRDQELPHEEAFAFTLARVLTAPDFLYRLETPGEGPDASPVSDHELATRLSYFLWSSLPDAELRRVADEARLRDPAVLRAQARRMLADDKVRRLAVEFACQWLHIRDFDQLDEKSERHFPEFAGLRQDMREESIRFFTDLFQHDGSVRAIINADHTFLNESLARFYGIPDVTGPEWRRVEGVHRYARGGILAQASTLARQSGASRTSPILRGNWVSETLLGEKLPRPPKNVPQLPDEVPRGLTERQLIERHASDPACAKCHRRIDPYGFSMEAFDAIGRFRETDAAGLSIDTRAQLMDGTGLEGVEGLRRYLGDTRQETFLRQFCRKLLGYSLGRAVQLSDQPLIDDMMKQIQSQDGRFAPLVETIVLSRQFREIRPR